MKKLDQNRLLMWRNIHQYLTENDSIWGSNPRYCEAVQTLGSAIAAADAGMLAQKMDTRGVTRLRKATGRAAILAVQRIAACARVLAADTHNKLLEAGTTIRWADLARGKTGDILPRLKSLMASVSPYRAALVAYGLNDDHYAAAEAAIASFGAQQNAPRYAISVRKTATTQVGQIVREGMNAVKQLDLLLGLYGENRAFVDGYAIHRHVELPARHTK